MRAPNIRTLSAAAILIAAAAAAAVGCGDSADSSAPATAGTTSGTDTTVTGSGGATTTTASSASTTTTTTATASSTGSTGGGGAGGSAPTGCMTTAKGQLRGSAIALTSDSSRLIAVNRDAGSVTVMSIDYTMANDPALALVAEIQVGSEPWQVVIDGCDDKAYVVLRKDQKVVEIDNLKTTPTMGKSVAIGSEPTSLAITPNNTKLYVSNWVDGNMSVIDPASMTVTSTIDFNATLAATGFLGPEAKAAPRAAMAHPRGIAITNNGDASDADETVYVTEWFAVRTGPEVAGTPLDSDLNWKGLLYKVPVATGTPTTIDLPPVKDTTFDDAKGGTTGCFPNQVASVSIDNEGTMAAPKYFAYVTSTCASPAGPTGVFQKGACQIDANCAGGAVGSCVGGSCKGSCVMDSDCGLPAVGGLCDVPGGGDCKPYTANAKTTTHPAVTIVDLAASTGTTSNLDALFASATTTILKTVSARMPLLPTDMDFKPGFAYVASEGADALFRISVANGVISAVGSPSNDFIDLHAGPATIRLPIGVAISQDPLKPVAFVANDGSRTVTAINLGVQAVSAGAMPELPSSAAPSGPALSVLNGKRLFTTGLGRWSLSGAAWGSCAACHIDGLTDNVTWYFARGPRQSTSLDGTFAKGDPTDQRILNWSAVNDEVADFEGNVRGISGGVGAIVSTANKVCTVATQATDCPNSQVCNAASLTCNLDPKDRINLLSSVPQQQGLQGSAAATAAGGALPTNWSDITNYIAQIRSPRAATPGLFAAADITAGKAVFTSGNCAGCHSGNKWTLSKVFYTPGNMPNDAFGSILGTSLSATTWLTAAKAANFPVTLYPSAMAGKQDMRSGAPPAFEQIQCVLRPVGTIVANGATPTGVSTTGATGVNVLELRQDMVTGAQGAGGVNPNDFTVGYNIPSLLGLQVGASFFHAGNARSLEELFSAALFKGHYQTAVADIFDPHNPEVTKQLVAYLLSIDGSTTPIAIPAMGPSGGDICHYP